MVGFITKPFNPELKSSEDPNRGNAETVNFKSFFFASFLFSYLHCHERDTFDSGV